MANTGPKHLAVIWQFNFFFYVKHCWVMVIRSSDVTDIAWVFARLEMKRLISNQHFTALLIWLRHTTT